MLVATVGFANDVVEGGWGKGGAVPSNLAGLGRFTIEIVKRSDAAKGFELLPRRGVLERAFAWLRRGRGLAKDWERSIASAEAWLLVAPHPCPHEAARMALMSRRPF
jgi:hypothetical protein